MNRKTVTLKALRGLRNDVDAERFEPGDLVTGQNIDVDHTGRVSRRMGTDQMHAGAMHSVWSDSDNAFLVRNLSLCRLTSSLQIEDLSFPILGARVTYASVSGRTYFSDKRVTGAVNSAGQVVPWGLPQPVVPAASVIHGDLPAGVYQYTMTFVRADGFESGAARARLVTLNASGGLEWATLPTNATAARVRVYVSALNGDTLYLAGEYAPGATSVRIMAAPIAGSRLRTQFLQPPMPGQLFGPWNGRLFVAASQFLAYTMPFEYELMAPEKDWLPFEGPVRMAAFVDDGFYVGTDRKTYFVAGTDPSVAGLREVLPYGVIEGTAVSPAPELVGKGLPSTRVVLWESTKGKCLGLPSGQVQNLTGERYAASPATIGAGVFIHSNALPQYRVTLFNQ